MKDVLLKTWDRIGTIVGWTETGFPKFITKEDCATEIANMVKAFDKWKDSPGSGVSIEIYWINIDDNEGIPEYKLFNKAVAYNDLFIYWYNEIREK